MKYKKFASIERKLINTIKYYCFYSWWNWLDMLPRRIYWFCQRGYRGYAHCDTWDFDVYLANIISEGLKDFRKYYHGARPTKKELDIIIKGFEENLKLMDLHYKYKSKKYNLSEIKFKKGMKLFNRYFNYLWD
jgi:hypothetical protein